MTSHKHQFTIDDLWGMARIGAPTVSPDGSLVCVPVTHYDMKENNSRTSLWLLSSDGKTQRQLTRGKNDGEPQFSPDGKSIAFVARRAPEDEKDKVEASHLYVIKIDGGEAERVSHLHTGAFGIRWFPDGKRIAFLSWSWPKVKSESEQNKRLAADKDDKVKAYLVDHNNYRYWDHWLPRGREVHLWSVDLKDGKSTDLFAGTAHFLPPADPGAHMYDIAPDGSAIAFVQDRLKDPQAPSYSDIVLLHVKSGKSVNLTAQSKQSQDSPRFSPDGKHIACLATDFKKAHNAQSRLAVIDVKTSTLKGVTFDWDLGVNGPLQWTASGKHILFSAEQREIQPLFCVALDGSLPVELSRGPGHGGSSGPLALSANGKTLVYLRAAIDYPPALFASDASGKNERSIESFNQKVLKERHLASTESVTIKGFEGDDVQMWIFKPAHFDAKKSWPLMHVIHGGPHTCFGDTWHWRWNAQLFAAAGYVVAEVNYHGSTGFGQRFVSSINGDWGRRELADVEAGTDYMLETGYIDARRVVATGGSYGGYMVAFMNGNSAKNRYQAYVCHAGCYDWVAMMGSDGYHWFGQELGAFPWQDEARVLKQSPHHYAKNFATPTLVIHGELDYRVPYYQGLAYFNTLRVQELETRLVFFPDENHWILKPQNSRLWYKEFFDWCNRFTDKKAAGAKAATPKKVVKVAKKKAVGRH